VTSSLHGYINPRQPLQEAPLSQRLHQPFACSMKALLMCQLGAAHAFSIGPEHHPATDTQQSVER
jgi:hypothetical protein